MSVDKLFYNRASANLLGWDPSWFGCEFFDEELLAAIAKYQRKSGLVADSLCGPDTFRRILMERTVLQSLATHKLEHQFSLFDKPTQKFIVNGDKQFPISWDKFIGLNDPKAMKADKSCYRVVPNKANKLFVLHHDVCLTSADCFRVLNRRGLSVHFMIDYDGTIYQSVDVAHSAQHAGSVNSWSIGVEICNPIEEKYNVYYTKTKGLPPRPIIASQKIHSTTHRKFLGYYPVQLEALSALTKTLCENLNIPKQTPDSTTVYQPALQGQYRGIIAHYHLNAGKWDAAGIDLQEFVKQL